MRYTCTHSETTNCELTAPGCQSAGECLGHNAACGLPAVRRFEGPDFLQYACTEHQAAMEQRYGVPEACPATGRSASVCTDQTHATCEQSYRASVRLDRKLDAEFRRLDPSF